MAVMPYDSSRGQTDASAPEEPTQAFERSKSGHEAASFDRLRSHPRYPMVIGQTSRLSEIAELIERAGNTDDSVLIQGERGTGKELVARAIAAASRLGKTPFIKVHCSAIPAEFLEAQLFGFDDGAVTDANLPHRKPGAFDAALHGILFLDEIGSITPSLQARLLDVLDRSTSRQFAPTGVNRGGARVIAATTRDLDQAAAEGQFSRDLLRRLSGISISLPALRDRREDIPALVDHFLKKFAAQQRQPFHALDPEVARRLMGHDWPGNIRELENVVKRAVVLGPDFSVEKELARRPPRPRVRSSRWVTTKAPHAGRAVAADLANSHAVSPEPAVKGTQTVRYSLKAISREAARRAERDLILRVLERTHWNRKAAAGLLQISYKALLYKIKENALDDETW